MVGKMSRTAVTNNSDLLTCIFFASVLDARPVANLWRCWHHHRWPKPSPQKLGPLAGCTNTASKWCIRRPVGSEENTPTDNKRAMSWCSFFQHTLYDRMTFFFAAASHVGCPWLLFCVQFQCTGDSPLLSSCFSCRGHHCGTDRNGGSVAQRRGAGDMVHFARLDKNGPKSDFFGWHVDTLTRVEL